MELTREIAEKALEEANRQIQDLGMTTANMLLLLVRILQVIAKEWMRIWLMFTEFCTI